MTEVRARSWSESYAYDESGNLAAAHWPVSPGRHKGVMSLPPEAYQDWKGYKKNLPEISDPTQGPDLYGLSGPMLGDLERHIIPGSGRSEEYAPEGWEATHDGKPLTWEKQNKQWSGEAAQQKAQEAALEAERQRREANKAAALARKAASGKH